MIKFELRKTPSNSLPAGLTVIGVPAESKGKGLAQAIDRELKRVKLEVKPWARHTVHISGGAKPIAARVSVLPKKAFSDIAEIDGWRRLAGDAISSAKSLSLSEIQIPLHGVSANILPRAIQSIVEGASLAAYNFVRFKKKKAEPTKIRVTIGLSGAPSQTLKQALRAGVVIADAVSAARDMVNTPPSNLPPREVVRAAKKLKLTRRDSIKVYNRAALKKMGAGALLGVSAGSDEEPFMIHISVKARKRTKQSKTVTLIGKGVTFDSGGLSLKPGKGMEDMKCDMAGAAAVIYTAQALLALRNDINLQHDVHFIAPITENMVNGSATKPGDVLRTVSGKTIEVLNTDAEGRLILADALGYAEKKIKSDVIIDLATLTGACIVAIGDRYSGLFSDSEEQIKRLTNASITAGEKLWRLPIAADYRSQMDSDVADIKNIGNGGPGATIGALFLKDFVPKNTEWVHIDIAGPAFVTYGGDYHKRGATGVGVRTLLEYLQS